MGNEPVIAVDLTFVKVNGGRGFASIANWDEDAPPRVGQHILAADGGSERLEAIITEVRPDGTLVLSFPAFEIPARAVG